MNKAHQFSWPSASRVAALSYDFMNIHTETKCQIIFSSGSSSSPLSGRGSAPTDCVSGWLFKASCYSSNESHFQRRFSLRWRWERRKQPQPPTFPSFVVRRWGGCWPWASQWMFVWTHKARDVSSLLCGLYIFIYIYVYMGSYALSAFEPGRSECNDVWSILTWTRWAQAFVKPEWNV